MKESTGHESGNAFNTCNDAFAGTRVALNNGLAESADKGVPSFLPEVQIRRTSAAIVRNERGQIVEFAVPGLVQSFLYGENQDQPNQVAMVVNGVTEVKFFKSGIGWLNDAQEELQESLRAALAFDSIEINQKTGTIIKQKTDGEGVKHKHTMNEDGSFQQCSSDESWSCGNLDGLQVISLPIGGGRFLAASSAVDGRQTYTTAQFDLDGNLIAAQYGNPAVKFAKGSWNTPDGKTPQGFESHNCIMKVTLHDGTVIILNDTTGSGEVKINDTSFALPV